MRSALILLAVAAAACAPRRTAPGPETEAPGAEGAAAACVLPAGDASPSGSRPTTLTIGLAEPVDPAHVPVPRNDAERTLFAHLYETLVRVACDGRVVPALAESWTAHDGGRRWTFRLREDARFWDGAPVTAHDVVFGKGGAGYTVGATDARTVSVLLARGTNDVPALLADPGLAVTKPSPDESWPIGTGAYWVTSATTTPEEIRALRFGPGAASDTLLFRIASSGDARDLLDAGVDLLVTRDPALRDYAAIQRGVVALELPWDRTYVFVTPEPGGTRFDGLEQAVRGPARHAEGPFWWLDLRACGQ
ncbi:MAG: ABC transporter substrate-binding protein, partial [Gemmatimonadales bacterium]